MRLPLLTTITLLVGALPSQAQLVMESFGKLPDGREVTLYHLRSNAGLRVTVMNYGATLVSVEALDRDGTLDHVALRLDTLHDYLTKNSLYGSIVGRYANRIDGGKLLIDGDSFPLKSVGGDGVHIHGGKAGLQTLLWEAEPIKNDDANGVRFTHTSPDGHEGFPGELRVSVTYLLKENENTLSLQYEATTTKPTHVNLTNHVYWNLAGVGTRDVLGHRLQIHAKEVLESDARKVPTGTRLPVAGTALDFLASHPVGDRIAELGGYDHCYVLDKKPGELALVARVEEPTTGRVLEAFTTEPGSQLYTGNHLSDQISFQNKPFGKYHGLCLEMQHFPDSPNHPEFPSTLLRPGETYRQTTEYHFSTLAK